MSTTTETAVEQNEEDVLQHEAPESPWKIAWQRFRKNRAAIGGLIIFVILVLSAVFSFVSPYEPDEMNFTMMRKPPSAKHWLGTDELGRDYLTRVLYGGQISMQVGLFAVLISVFAGALVGGIAGFYGGKIDHLLMRFTEIVMSFPFLPLAITIAAVIGTRVKPENKMYIVMAIIGLLSWPSLARIIRGQILSLREQEFILATRALGLSDARVIIRHLLPNTIGYIIVHATLRMASAILIESGLSFLGLGVVPPVPTWGNLVLYARDLYTLTYRPWLWVPPGIFIFLAVMSINLVGDGLRDALDPRSKG